MQPTTSCEDLPPFLRLDPRHIAAGLLLGLAALIRRGLLRDGAATSGMLLVVELVGYARKSCSAKELFRHHSTLLIATTPEAFGSRVSGVWPPCCL